MSDQPSANHATTFKLALLAMLLSIWLIGRTSGPEVVEPQVVPGQRVIDAPSVVTPGVGPMVDPSVAPSVITMKDGKVEVEAPATGRIEGFVKFVGEKQELPTIELVAGSYCAQVHQQGAQRLTTEQWVWGENDTLQNVLIHVTGGLPDIRWAPPAESAVIRLHECRIKPHITAVAPGQLIEIHNLDRTLHAPEIRPSLSEGATDSLKQPGTILPWLATRPEIGIPLKCNVHPWMNGIIHIMSHPFYDITGPQGTFEISNLPPGEYEISLWHEVKAFRESVEPVKVKIEPGKTTQVSFTIKPAAN